MKKNIGKDAKKIICRLSKHIKKNEISMYEASKRIGVNRSTMTRWIKREIGVSLDAYFKIQTFLEEFEKIEAAKA